MNHTLVIVTRPLDQIPAVKRAAAFAVAAELVLIENGVYLTADDITGAGLSADAVRVVADDADARRAASPFARIGWDGLVDAIEKNRNVITL